MSQTLNIYTTHASLSDAQVADLQGYSQATVLAPKRFANRLADAAEAGQARDVNGHSVAGHGTSALIKQIVGSVSKHRVVIIADELDEAEIAALKARFTDDFLVAKNYEEVLGAVLAAA